MNHHMPRTPLSTHLSRSARETEIRIRNIFSGPKKRPPVLLMILIASLILLCGNLVAFRPWPAAPTLVMETQYYDTNSNYIEIPALALPAGERNEAVEAINAALNDLRGAYADLASRTGGDAWDNQCLFYPSTTSRYLNLLFFRSQFTTDLNTGHVFSLVYDLKEGTLVPAEDALALAGLNEKGLLDQVTEQAQPQIDREYQEYDFQLALHNLTLEGFRIKADGQPVFYLTGRVDDVDDTVNDAISGADVLYIWEDRMVEEYAQYSGEPVPLVPADETDQLDPPLWNQWYFAGEEPKGGYSPAPVSAQTVADLDDPEICLYRDGFSTPIGLGNWAELFPEFKPEVTNISSWRTDPQSGRTESWSIDGGGEKGGVYAERFYDAKADRYTLLCLDTGRPDMYTPRGIRVGSTREEVLAAYPGLLSDEQIGSWFDYDYLWYSADKIGIPPLLYFHFNEDDVVCLIQMRVLYKP